MSHIKWEISPAAALLFAALYFVDREGLFAAALPAVVCHEAGHALFLRLGGLELRRVRLGAAGLEMDCRGEPTGLRGAAAIAAGPLFGLAYAIALRTFYPLSAAVSAALTAFNMLPLLPLDGGRLLCLALPAKGRAISRICSWLCFAAAWIFWLRTGYIAPFLMSGWLVWENIA